VSQATGPTVIAIDGPAGSGKSTVARALAARLGLGYLDTGAMYRAVTWAVLRDSLDPAASDEVTDLAERTDLTVGERVLVDGTDVTGPIRGPEVSGAVSIVAANPGVRRVLVARQRAWVAEHGGGVVEGRDIGTVVFPDAVLKLYLTARPEVRAARRAAEVGEADEATVAQWAANLAERDRLDSTRADSPLREASDATVVDTSDRGVAEIVEDIVGRLS
jgi:cytidylate kinase